MNKEFIIIITAGLSFYDFEPAKKLTTKVIFIEINKFTTPLMLQLEHTDWQDIKLAVFIDFSLSEYDDLINSLSLNCQSNSWSPAN